MYTTQQLIERLEAIQKKEGKALYVALQIGEDLPDIKEIATPIDHGQTGEKIVVLIPDNI